MSKRDYYEVLDIPKNVSAQDLKKAYRKKAMQYHPDQNPDDHEAEDKFKEAAEAYEVLHDESKRKLYDQFGHAGLNQRGFSGFDDVFSSFSDIFEDFFGFSGGQRRGGPNQPTRGADLRYDLEIEFMDASDGIRLGPRLDYEIDLTL